MPKDDVCSWTADKAEINLRKHGYDFAQLAVAFDGRPSVTRTDTRFDYGEERFNTLVMFDRRIINVTWTPRDGLRHLISARPASREERAIYDEATHREDRDDVRP